MSRPKAPSERKGHANRAKPMPAPNEVVIDPDPPAHLGDVGRSVWSRLWLWGVGVYRSTDSDTIERYCHLQEKRQAMIAVIADDGWFADGAAGQQVAHPAVAILKDCEAKLTTLEDRLYLSPDARVRAGAFAEVSSDDLDEFLTS